ncbi:hypothetical protein Gogos_020524 [Gossypium gossypioides]|uniref:Uncharacterized protein n=1 Tax=Gossypium gossypioides TaxID=34282 RepID=A0A7J9D2D3_GOSGO|nr:hypothetical protein [Gossypium gossypioides]
MASIRPTVGSANTIRGSRNSGSNSG